MKTKIRLGETLLNRERITSEMLALQAELAIKDVNDAIEAVTRTDDPAGIPIRRELELAYRATGTEMDRSVEMRIRTCANKFRIVSNVIISEQHSCSSLLKQYAYGY